MIRPLCRLALIAALGGCIGVTTPSGAPPDPNVPGSWIVLAPMPSARQELAVTVVTGHGLKHLDPEPVTSSIPLVEPTLTAAERALKEG